MTTQERDTILAALRYWQNRGSPFQPMEDLEDIATNFHTRPELTVDEIDELCERLERENSDA
jgi:hypothetical protein